MNIPNTFVAYEKVRKTINSCRNSSHLKGARQLIVNFNVMFPTEIIYSDALHVRELRKNKELKS